MTLFWGAVWVVGALAVGSAVICLCLIAGLSRLDLHFDEDAPPPGKQGGKR